MNTNLVGTGFISVTAAADKRLMPLFKLDSPKKHTNLLGPDALISRKIIFQTSNSSLEAHPCMPLPTVVSSIFVSIMELAHTSEILKMLKPIKINSSLKDQMFTRPN